MSRKKVTKEEVLEWHRLNAEKSLSLAEIGKRFNRDFKTLQLNLKKYGLKSINNVKVTELEIEEMYSYYMSAPSISLNQTANKFRRDASCMRNWFVERGWRIKSLSEVGSANPNHDFFEVIDCEEKAYLLGLFASDGHIEKRSDYDSYCLKYAFHKRDAELIDLVNKYIGNGNYKSYPHACSNQVCISITSKKIGLDLAKLGYDNRKTYTTKSIPSMSKDCMRHFIRGYFDGDGCITVTPRTCYGRSNGFNKQFSIAAYSKEILEAILAELPVEPSRVKFYYQTGTKFTIKGKDYTASGHTFSIRHSEELRKIHQYLYLDANLFLKRKKEKFDLAILNAKQLYEALASNS